jgi:hypothetical protein
MKCMNAGLVDRCSGTPIHYLPPSPPSSISIRVRRGVVQTVCSRCSRMLARYRPVRLSATAATSSGVPIATTRPPSGPAPGPRSTIQSAVLIAEHAQQLLDVVQVQAGGGLVEDVELLAAAPRALGQLARDDESIWAASPWACR